MIRTGKRWIAALLAVIMVMSLGSTALAEAAPAEYALKASRLEDLPEGNVIYMGTAAATVEEEAAIYSFPIYREGDLSREASVTLRTLDLSAVYGKDYTLLENGVEETGDGVSILERSADVGLQDAGEPPAAETDAPKPEDSRTEELRDSAAESTLAQQVAEQTGRPTRELYETPGEDLMTAIVGNSVAAQIGQVDYSSQMTVTFAPGEAEKTLRFQILDDRQSEGVEGFSLLLVDPRGAELWQVTSLAVTINDNEPTERSVVSFSSGRYRAEDSAVTVTVKRTGAEYSLCSFTLQSVGETAAAGTNYREINEDFAFSPYETERTFTIPVTGEGMFTLKMSNFTACDAGQYPSAVISLPQQADTAVLAEDPPLLGSSKSMNIKVDGKEYTVRYDMPSDGAKGASKGTIVDTGYKPELEVGEYFFSLDTSHGGMFTYGNFEGNDPTWRGHLANEYHFKNTGDMSTDSHYGSLEYYSSWVGDKGKETALTDDVFPDYYQTFVPDWCSTSGFGGGQEFQIVYGSRTGDIEGCGSFNRTQSNNAVKINGMGISDGHYVRVKAVDDNVYRTPKSYLEFYGVAAMYKKIEVSLETPNELTYQLGNLQTKSLAMQAHLNSGVREVYGKDKAFFFANPDAGKTNLVVNLDTTLLNGHAGIFGHVTGFTLSITGGKDENRKTVNYPQDYLTYLKANRDGWISSEAKIKAADIDAEIQTAGNNPAVIPYDRFFFAWIESVQSDVVSTSQGYYQKLSIKPVVAYDDVTVEVLEPALGAGTGKFTDQTLSAPGINTYHSGDTLDLSAAATDPQKNHVIGYEVSTNGGISYDTITSDKYLFLESNRSYKIRPAVSPIRNKIEIVFTGDAAQHLTVQGLFKEGDDGELAQDPELSAFKDLHILKANPDNDPAHKKTLVEQMEPVKGRIYTINFTCEENDSSIYLPVISCGNQTFRTNSFHHVAAAAVADNVITVGCEKVDKSALTTFTVSGTLMSDFRPIRYSGMETQRLPVAGYTVTSGTNTQVKDQQGTVMPQAAASVSEANGGFTLSNILGRSGDWITMAVSNGVTNGQVVPVKLGTAAATDAGEVKLQYPYGAPQVMDQMVTCLYDKDENNKTLDTRSNQIRICDDNLNLTATVNLNGNSVDRVVFTTYTLKGVKTEYPASCVKSDGNLSIFQCKIKKMPDVLHPGDRVSVRLEYVGDGSAPTVVYPDVDTGFMFYTSNEVKMPQTFDLTGMKIDIPLVGSATGVAQSGLLNFSVTRWDDTPDGVPTGYSINVNADTMFRSKCKKEPTPKETLDAFKEFREKANDTKLSQENLSGAERMYAFLMSDDDPDSYPMSYWQNDLAQKRQDLQDAKKAMGGLQPSYSIEIAVVLVFDFVYDKTKDEYIFSTGTVAVGGTFDCSKTMYTVLMGVPVFLNLQGKIQVNAVVSYATQAGQAAMTAGEFDEYTGNLAERLSGTDARLLLNLTGKATVGVGMCGVVSAGGYVAMNLQFDIPVYTKLDNPGTLLKIGGGLSFSAIVLSLDIKLVEYTKGWGSLEKVSTFTFINGLFEEKIPDNAKAANGSDVTVLSVKDNQVLTAHEYSPGTCDLSAFGQGAGLQSEGENVLLSNSAERSSPQLVSLGGNKLLMSFLGDNNGTQALFYSVFDGSAWSAPALVADDGTLDATPEMAVVGDKVLLTWTDASAPFEEGELFSSKLNKLGISCAIYDPVENTMGVETDLIQDGYFNQSPQIATDGDEAYISYLKRDLAGRELAVTDAEQILDVTGIYSVMARVHVDPGSGRALQTNGVVETKVSVLHPILDDPLVTDYSAAAAKVGGDSWLLETYTVDPNKEIVNSGEDRELYLALTNQTKNKQYRPIQINADSENPSAPRLTRLGDEVWLSWLSDGYLFRLANVTDLLTALFAPVNDTETGSVPLDTAAITAAYGQADGASWSWYKKNSSDLNMNEEQFAGSIYDDLTQGRLRTYSTAFWADDALQTATDSYRLVTDGTDLYVFFADYDQAPTSTGRDLCGFRFQPQGKETGFSGGVRLTGGNQVLDEMDLTMTENGTMVAVANCYSYKEDGDGRLQKSGSSLVQLGVVPAGKLSVSEDTVRLPSDLSPGSSGTISFSLENSGLKDAAGYQATVNILSDGTRTEIGSITEQESLRGGQSRDLSVGWKSIPGGLSDPQIEIVITQLDGTGSPIGAAAVTTVDVSSEARLSVEDLEITRGSTDGEAHLTAVLHNYGNAAASATQLTLALCDTNGKALQTIDAGALTSLAPGAEAPIDLVFTPKKTAFNQLGYADVELEAASAEDSDIAYARLFQSALSAYDRWSSGTTPEPQPKPPSGGGGSAPAVNPVTLPASATSATTHGKVSSSAASAKAGDKVTLTLTPDEGWQAAGVTVTDAKGNVIPVTKNPDGTYSFTMPATAVTVTPEFVELPDPAPTGDVSDRFTDVSKTAWYHDAVQWAVDKGLMNGVSEDTFAPNETCTRAMVVTMLWRLAGEPASSAAAPFTDVKAGSWYADAVNWAAETGAVKGTSETTFSPETPVTREQLAAILYRYAQAQGEGFTGAWAFPLDYSDAADVSEWANEAMHWMTMHGIITGMGDGTLAPQDNATRAQIAAMFMRFCAEIEK